MLCRGLTFSFITSVGPVEVTPSVSLPLVDRIGSLGPYLDDWDISGELNITSSTPSFIISLPDTFLMRLNFLIGGFLSSLVTLVGVLGSKEECLPAGVAACNVGSSSL